jgi:hypothetical protein
VVQAQAALQNQQPGATPPGSTPPAPSAPPASTNPNVTAVNQELAEGSGQETPAVTAARAQLAADQKAAAGATYGYGTDTVNQSVALGREGQVNQLYASKIAADQAAIASAIQSQGQQYGQTTAAGQQTAPTVVNGKVIQPQTGTTIATAPSYSVGTNLLAGGAPFSVNANTGLDANGNPISANSGTPSGAPTSAPSGSVAASGGATFAQNATVAGSSAAGNNVSGLKGLDGKFVTYADPAQSLAATTADIAAKQQGDTTTGLTPQSTLGQFLATWVNGPGSTQLPGYAASVVQQLGVPLTTPFSQIPAASLASAVARGETGYQQQYTGTGIPEIDSAVTQVLSGVPVESLGLSSTQIAYVNTLAAAADPSYNPNTNTVNQANKASAQSNAVQLQQQITSANTQLALLQTAANQTGFGSNSITNDIRKTWGTITGNSNVLTFNEAVADARASVAAVLGGGTPTDASRAEASQLLPDNISAANLKSVIATAEQQMNAKLGAYTNPSSVPKVGQTSQVSQPLTVTNTPLSQYNFSIGQTLQ